MSVESKAALFHRAHLGCRGVEASPWVIVGSFLYFGFHLADVENDILSLLRQSNSFSTCDIAVILPVRDAYLVVHALEIVHRHLGRCSDETFELVHL